MLASTRTASKGGLGDLVAASLVKHSSFTTQRPHVTTLRARALRRPAILARVGFDPTLSRLPPTRDRVRWLEDGPCSHQRRATRRQRSYARPPHLHR